MNQRQIRREARLLVEDAVAAFAVDDCSEWEEDPDNTGEEVRQTYMGTVFSLTPSGKYYMPWACSNVDPCPRCKGNGCDYCWGTGSREAMEDECFWEWVEHYADKHGISPHGDNGDPCDVLFAEFRDMEEE